MIEASSGTDSIQLHYKVVVVWKESYYVLGDGDRTHLIHV